METHARIFYTAKTLGVLERMHGAIFKAIQQERKRLQTENQIATLFAKHGVDNAKFKKTYNSFSVQSKTKQALAVSKSYGVRGVPSFVVNGKYMMNINLLGGETPIVGEGDILNIVNYFANQERKLLSER